MKRRLLLFPLLLWACSLQSPKYEFSSWTQTGDTQEKSQKTDPESERTWIETEGKKVLSSLATKDMKSFVNLIHEEQGVRFSAYWNFEQDDLILRKNAILTETETPLKWGYYAGNGEEITLSIPEYFSTFVYSHDFLNAPEVLINTTTDRGGIIVNIEETFPDAAYVEYFFPGFEAQYEGMDWVGLFLIFDKKSKKLIGIAHEERTS